MATLKLKADPTFHARVPIPVPGKAPVQVSFTFKHRTRAELDEFFERGSTQDVGLLDYLMDFVSGWDLTDPFSRENVGALINEFPGAAAAISRTYVEQLMGAARQGN